MQCFKMQLLKTIENSLKQLANLRFLDKFWSNREEYLKLSFLTNSIFSLFFSPKSIASNCSYYNCDRSPITLKHTVGLMANGKWKMDDSRMQYIVRIACWARDNVKHILYQNF